jgi:hypothetical protein
MRRAPTLCGIRIKNGVTLMNIEPHAAPQRAYFLDWLRIGGFALLVVYHVGMYYVSWDWHVKSPFAGPGLEPWMLLSSPWRMALLFVVSGAATSFMLRGAAASAFLAGRSKRLLLPLLCGVLLVIPPQSYFEAIHRFGYAGGYVDFVRLYFAGHGGFCRDGKCLILPTWNHLWFVAYLWVYTVVLWALLQRWPRLLDILARIGDRRLRDRRLLLWPIVLLALLRVALYPRFGSTHALIDDAYNHAVFFSLFVAGAVFARWPGVWERLAALRWSALLTALGGWLVLAAFAQRFAAAGVAPDALRIAQRVGFAAVQWGALVAAIGFARCHLDVDLRWRATLTEAVFPVYILHQTIIVLLAQALLPLRWTPRFEAPLLIGSTFVLSFVGYLVLRRLSWLRPWFGMARGAAVLALGPGVRAGVTALVALLAVGLLLGCAAALPAKRLATPAGEFTLREAGAGSPSVVFQSGLGDGAQVWQQVAPRIAETTNVLALDRPGYGGSTLAAGPRDPCTIAAEQHALLAAMRVRPP